MPHKAKKRSDALWQRDEERRVNWVIGRGVVRTEFESRLASWAGVTPEPSLDEVIRALYVAWSPPGRSFLQALLSEAEANPSHIGLARAIRSARMIWRDVFRKPAAPKGGRPPPKWAEKQFNIWLFFNIALVRARKRKPKTSKNEMMRRFLQSSKYAREAGVTSERLLKKILGEVDKSPGTDRRARMLQKMLSLQKELGHKTIAKDSR